MKTRADQGAAAPERRGRATGIQPPTRTSVAPVNDSLVRRAADDTASRPEAERGALRVRAGQGMLILQGLTLGVLGGVALAWSMGFTRFGADGTPLLGQPVIQHRRDQGSRLDPQLGADRGCQGLQL